MTFPSLHPPHTPLLEFSQYWPPHLIPSPDPPQCGPSVSTACSSGVSARSLSVPSPPGPSIWGGGLLGVSFWELHPFYYKRTSKSECSQAQFFPNSGPALQHRTKKTLPKDWKSPGWKRNFVQGLPFPASRSKPCHKPGSLS